MYWMGLISYYNGGWPLILITIFEIVVFAWIYGTTLNHVCSSDIT